MGETDPINDAINKKPPHRFQPGNKLAKGGARPGAGPKVSKATELKQAIAENAAADIEKLRALAEDIETPANVRADILKMFVHYSLGKPTEHVQTEAKVEIEDARSASVSELGAAVGPLKLTG